MKKTNVIIFLVIILVSAFLLWLWYYLGLNHVDDPLDLLISIVWWVMVIVAIVVIIMVERKRKEQIRTLYVSDDILFNPELGSINYVGLFELLKEAETMLDDLKYTFKKEDLPNPNAFPIKVIIKTKAYKNENDWEGKVIIVSLKQEQEFNDKEELFNILNDSRLFDETSIPA